MPVEENCMYSRKDILTVPNILGYFRIILIPFFMYTYMTAESVKDYYVSAALVGVSSFTDFCDGFIARKYNMVTELGKLIDPLADKLTQCAFIVCFIMKYEYMRYLLAIYVVKESFMVGAGLAMLKHNGKKLNGAKWFGKVSTALIYLVMFVLFLQPILMQSMAASTINFMILFCIFLVIASLILYIPVFFKMYKET